MQMTLIQKIQAFTATLSREEFYDFYLAMCAMAGPTRDRLRTPDGILDVKHIVRRLRITLMHPRFASDYAEPYTPEDALREQKELERLLPVVEDVGVNQVSKLIKVLSIVARVLPVPEEYLLGEDDRSSNAEGCVFFVWPTEAPPGAWRYRALRNIQFGKFLQLAPDVPPVFLTNEGKQLTKNGFRFTETFELLNPSLQSLVADVFKETAIELRGYGFLTKEEKNWLFRESIRTVEGLVAVSCLSDLSKFLERVGVCAHRIEAYQRHFTKLDTLLEELKGSIAEPGCSEGCAEYLRVLDQQEDVSESLLIAIKQEILSKLLEWNATMTPLPLPEKQEPVGNAAPPQDGEQPCPLVTSGFTPGQPE